METLDVLSKYSDQELLEAYHKARRLYVEQKFARDTERGRLEWQSARAFVTGKGGVTERQMAVEASEELAKKGQHVREMTRDLDLLKVDIDVLAMILRNRTKPDDRGFSDHDQEPLQG